MKAAALLVLSLWASPANGQPTQPVRPTLEQIFSSPFSSELVAAPRGQCVAWVVNENGARNVWIWIPAEKAGRPLTSYAADDGQEITGLAWTPDATAIAYTRGGNPGPNGESPNPTSNPRGFRQLVYLVSLAGGQPRLLGEGHSPAVSANLIVWQKGDQILSASVTTGEAKPLFLGGGRDHSLRWSPDGRSLAFVNDRGGHSFIGIYRPEDSSVRYLDPAVDRDIEPTWSPDGTRLAFVRLPGAREGPVLTQGEETLYPWSIWVADAATGVGHAVFRSGDVPEDGYRSLAGAQSLLWGTHDTLVFPWESGGWLHLFAVSASGGAPRRLTGGACEVEETALTRDGNRVIYSSNCGDIDRRHISTIPVEGGDSEALTQGPGIEWNPTTIETGDVAFLASNAQHAGRPQVLVTGSRQLRDIAPQSAGRAPLVEPQGVVLEADDGVRFHSQLFLPAGIRAGEKRPAVLFLHGGPRTQMLLGWHYLEYYHNAYATNQYLASRGYIVLSVNYRGGVGYGRAFREASDFGWKGAAEYRDVVAAARYLRSRPDVDASRVGIWGGSHGGYLAALGLARNSDLFRAGVDFHGVHDWTTKFARFIPSWRGEAMDVASRIAFESSPAASVATWRSPVLLIHGADDRNVAFGQSVDLSRRLREHNVEVEVLVFPDETHDFLTHDHWLQACRATAGFFERRLRR